MKFVTKLNKDLKVKNIEKESDKAIYVSVTRSIRSQSFDDKLEKVWGWKLFNDNMWIPKSQIIDGCVSTWFAEKNEIVTIN